MEKKHGCNVIYKQHISYINLSFEHENDIAKEYLDEIFIPVLANIIFSYYSKLWHWKYVESHESTHSSVRDWHANLTGCIIFNDEVMCLHTCIRDQVHITDINMLSVIDTSQDNVENIYCDDLCIYVKFNYIIKIIHYYENTMSEMVILNRGTELYCGALLLSNKIKCIKNDIFYVIEFEYQNITICNPPEPQKKYSIKNIALCADTETGVVSQEYRRTECASQEYRRTECASQEYRRTECVSQEYRRTECASQEYRRTECASASERPARTQRRLDITSILVSDNEIIVAIYDQYLSKNIFKKIENTEITYISSNNKIQLLYQDGDNIIYMSSSFLVRHTKSTKEIHRFYLNYNCDNVCLNENILCVKHHDRVDIYKN